MSVIIVPCSGIGKSYGTVTREAAYLVVDELRPDDTQIVPLSLLVLGDAGRSGGGARRAGDHPGRLQAGLRHGQRRPGRRPRAAREFTVLDCYRRHKDMKPQGIAELNEGGLALARALAEEVAQAARTQSLRLKEALPMPSPARNAKSVSWPAPARRWPKAL